MLDYLQELVTPSLKPKCRYFDKMFMTGFTEILKMTISSATSDRKFHKNVITVVIFFLYYSDETSKNTSKDEVRTKIMASESAQHDLFECIQCNQVKINRLRKFILGIHSP